jgi:arginase family enzyme
MRAVRRRHSRLTIVHIDAHADIYHAYQDNLRSHASPFARIMEERLTDRLIQIGIRTVNDHHREQFARFGVEVIEMARWEADLRLDIRNTDLYLVGPGRARSCVCARRVASGTGWALDAPGDQPDSKSESAHRGW